jgi:mono/diheme cytochrome c family protein
MDGATRMMHTWMFGILGMLALVACDREKPSTKVAKSEPQVTATPATPAPAAPGPDFSVESLTRGAALYREHCLQCHGPEGEGHPDWQTPTDGTFTAAPPLNGTGNDWKRPKGDMVAIIKNGVAKNGVPAMPGYKERLNEQEIEAVITWFQVLWPPDVYDRWLKANIAERG